LKSSGRKKMDELYIFHASKNKNLTNALPSYKLLTQNVIK